MGGVETITTMRRGFVHLLYMCPSASLGNDTRMFNPQVCTETTLVNLPHKVGPIDLVQILLCICVCGDFNIEAPVYVYVSQQIKLVKNKRLRTERIP